MFGLHSFPDGPDRNSWRGEKPPFHVPVLVLTRALCPSIETAGGTMFHFLSASPTESLDHALEAADGRDIRIGGDDAIEQLAGLRAGRDGDIGVGGAILATQLLRAKLPDELLLFTHPVILGRGRPLLDMSTPR